MTVFVNSDAGLIRFFLRSLEAAGIQQRDLSFRVHIHESADVNAAQRFWQEATGAPAEQFTEPAQAAQPQNKKEERRRQLPRMPPRIRVSQQCPLPQDRRLGVSGHGNRPSRPAVEPSFLAPGEGFEPSLSGPKPLVLPIRPPGTATPTLPGISLRSGIRHSLPARAGYGDRSGSRQARIVRAKRGSVAHREHPVTDHKS
jgi:hypothetical protein